MGGWVRGFFLFQVPSGVSPSAPAAYVGAPPRYPRTLPTLSHRKHASCVFQKTGSMLLVCSETAEVHFLCFLEQAGSMLPACSRTNRKQHLGMSSPADISFSTKSLDFLIFNLLKPRDVYHCVLWNSLVRWAATRVSEMVWGSRSSEGVPMTLGLYGFWIFRGTTENQNPKKLEIMSTSPSTSSTRPLSLRPKVLTSSREYHDIRPRA